MSRKKLLLLEVSMLLIIPVVYTLSWQSFVLSTSLSLLAAVSAFMLFHQIEDILYFFCGVVLGSIGEMCCVFFNVWEYTEPHFLGIPLWLSIFWGYSFVVIRRVRITFLNKNEKKNTIPNVGIKSWLFLLLVYLLLMFIPSLLYQYNIAAFAGLLIITAFYLYKGDGEDLYFALMFGILGPALEMFCAYVGIWKYTNPDFGGIPLWLILLYSGFSLFVKKVVNTTTATLHKS